MAISIHRDFLKKNWPDFTEKDYNKIIKSYKKIKRNFGNIMEKN